MIQDKTAFLEYPLLQMGDSFDQVRMDFYLDRARTQIEIAMFDGGQEVGKYQAHVPQERLYEQYAIELLFAEQHRGRGVKYEIQIHGEFPQGPLN
ncbi:MAG: hypothetical protein Q7S55_03545 [Nanoarchaeota archaeon]|nr:hypothetical protein [Nanoarchaeota archaeon]